MSEKELLERIKVLEEENQKLKKEIEDYKTRIQEMEFLIYELSETSKKEFESYDEFVEDLITRELIDENTRVYSRKFFEKMFYLFFEKSFEKGKTYGFIVVKIPNMEKLNEMMSSEDKIWFERGLGKRLRESVRVPLDVVARYDVNNFVIMIPDTTREILEKITTRLGNNLKEIEEKLGRIKIVSFLLPEDAKSTDEILKVLEEKV